MKTGGRLTLPPVFIRSVPLLLQPLQEIDQLVLLRLVGNGDMAHAGSGNERVVAGNPLAQIVLGPDAARLLNRFGIGEARDRTGGAAIDADQRWAEGVGGG